MTATLVVPTALRGFTERKSELSLEGATAGELLEALVALYPDIRPHLFDGEGALRGFVNVFVGEVNIKGTGGLDTPVKDGGSVMIVPAIAGGAGSFPSAGGGRIR
ncbi:MAG: MoaD/ThiS family protein [Deltaproteobacteria bacterium]|jgi:molybdopterin converting factor small subunit|nr:MoaD/ThiS family protein [Deltaproteobacteria bacterium]